MPTYEQLKSLTATEFRRACGVKLQTFTRMVTILTEAKARQQPGRPSALSVENQLLLTLEYLREYRTYFHIAQSWGLHESTVCRIVRKTEDILIAAKEFHVPGKKSLHSPEATGIAVVVVDATEQSIEKPQKNKRATTRERKDIIV